MRWWISLRRIVGVTLVNTSAMEPITVVVQAGGYGEHQFLSASVNGKEVAIDSLT